MVINRTAVMMVARLMELTARTASKAKGVDTIFSRILTGKKIQARAGHPADTGEKRKISSFIRDVKNITDCDA